MKYKIGIGISTTPNRKLIGRTLKQWEKHLPPGAMLIVENDQGYEGVARTKNKLLAALDHCDYIFLADDDCWPIADSWWVPYIESGEAHLMYQFKLPSKPKTDMRVLHRDDKIIAYSQTRGAMLFIKREVLDVVGGMDEDYGQAIGEHPDWTNRIHNAGLTKYRAMDVVGSDKLFYCLDQDAQIASSIPAHVKRERTVANRGRYQKSKTSKGYKAYK